MSPLRLSSLLLSAVYLATIPWHPYPGSAWIKGASILLLAALSLRADHTLLSLALLLSSVGDIVLDLSPELFVAGLSSFLLAHLTYVVLFVRGWERPLRRSVGQVALIVAVVVYTAAFAAWLIPSLGPLAIPVAFYICAITAMVTSAVLARFTSVGVVTGAILFLISDSILAVNKFKTAVPLRDYLVWTTYYAAQYSIATGLCSARSRDTIKLA